MANSNSKNNSLDNSLDELLTFDGDEGMIPELDEAYRPADALYIPDAAREDFAARGFALHWVRINAPGSVSGEFDMVNIQRKEAEGYTFVERKDIKGLGENVSSYFGDEFATTDRGLYRKGDLALAKIPQRLLDRKREYYAEQTRKRFEAIKHDLRRDARPNEDLRQGNTKEGINFGEVKHQKKGSKSRDFG